MASVHWVLDRLCEDSKGLTLNASQEGDPVTQLQTNLPNAGTVTFLLKLESHSTEERGQGPPS
jgi:hypothetical protein